MRDHEDEHLRRFVAARARGDRAEMQRWWEELVIDMFDRMDAFVGLAHRGRLDDGEHQLAVQLSMIRFARNLIDTYRGTSMGELVNASKTLARGICIDVQRASVRKRDAMSIDEGWHHDAEDGAGPSWAEGDEARRRFDADERGREAQDFLDWAMPRLNQSRRRVIELTLDGVPLAEIAAELDITHENAYQRRSRGVKDLKKLKERYDA